MAGLVLEGGTFRPIFSCGVMDALLDNGIEFPYVIGVSAGIILRQIKVYLVLNLHMEQFQMN